MRLETILARITDNCSINDPYGSSHLPIYQTATFDLKKQSGEKIYDYSRTDNPTRNALEEIFTIAENGSGCVCTNTGLSAMALLFETTLKANDSILIGLDCYGGTYRLLKVISEKYGINVHYIDFIETEKVEEYLKNNSVKLVLCESPTNPGLKIIDINKISGLCKKYNAILAVDNSLATFASQKPLDLGADFSISSATKYISGHGCIVAGFIVAKDPEWAEKLRYFANAEGRTQSPHDAFLISLGLPTLPYRLQVHEQNALKIAEYLTGRNDIKKVIFPGLENHPQYSLAKKQMKYIPGILTIEMNSMEKTDAFVCKTKLFGEKASFGSSDSRIEQPVKISHHCYSEEDLNAIGITDTTLRLSIGLENVDDLISDIDIALR